MTEVRARTPTRRVASRAVLVSVSLAALSAFLVWNGIFGLHVSRGEKQYLLEQARYRLGERDVPSVSRIMGDTVHAGAQEATRWAVVVFVLGLAGAYAGVRATRR